MNDDEGTVYNVEMERGKKRRVVLPKRARYYQENIDLDIISAGEDYKELKKSFVIFICTFDPFGEGRHIYTFENRCKENPALALGDETTKIFLNTKGTVPDVDEDMQEFLSYVENTTDAFAKQALSPLIQEIHRRDKEVKESKEMEVEYMTLLQRDRENIELGREEGIELGREEGREEGAKNATKIIKLYNKGMDSTNISSSLQLDLEYVNFVITDYEKD